MREIKFLVVTMVLSYLMLLRLDESQPRFKKTGQCKIILLSHELRLVQVKKLAEN